MGAWSHEPFGNDDAADWASALAEKRDSGYLEQTLDKALRGGYLEAPNAAEAIAAAEVLAKMLGRGTQSDAYTEEVDAWVRSAGKPPSPALLQKAQRALDRTMAEDSELRELWAEEPQWVESVRALRQALERA